MSDRTTAIEHTTASSFGSDADGPVPAHCVWRRLVGTRFAIHTGDSGTGRLELMSTSELQGGGDCFSLVFRQHEGSSLGQRTYRLEHPSLGAFPLFLVALGPGAEGDNELEAVVNRAGSEQ